MGVATDWQRYNVSHDSTNRFLLRERDEARDLFESVKNVIKLIGGILSVDDIVINTFANLVQRVEKTLTVNFLSSEAWQK